MSKNDENQKKKKSIELWKEVKRAWKDGLLSFKYRNKQKSNILKLCQIDWRAFGQVDTQHKEWYSLWELSLILRISFKSTLIIFDLVFPPLITHLPPLIKFAQVLTIFDNFSQLWSFPWDYRQFLVAFDSRWPSSFGFWSKSSSTYRDWHPSASDLMLVSIH